MPSLVGSEMCIRDSVYPAAACQQVVILGQHMVRAVSLSCRKTEMYILVGIVLHMETRSDEIAVLTAMVAADTTHQHQFIVPVVGVLLSLIHISEPTRLGMISYAVFCLKKKKQEKK